FQRWDDIEGQASALLALGHAHMALREGQQSHNYYERARDTFRLIGDRKGQASALSGLARLEQEQGKAQKAAQLYGEALPHAVAGKAPKMETVIRESLKNLSPLVGQPPANP